MVCTLTFTFAAFSDWLVCLPVSGLLSW